MKRQKKRHEMKLKVAAKCVVLCLLPLSVTFHINLFAFLLDSGDRVVDAGFHPVSYGWSELDNPSSWVR